MKIVLVGSGGREHALAWAIVRSPLCEELICLPGNPGMAALGRCVNIGPEDVPKITAFCVSEKPDLVVVGPEVPLMMGLADELRAEHILVVGPSAEAARLEGSKAFTKDLCKRFGIPAAASEHFDDRESAEAYVRDHELPVVIKADGLAAGKGVIIAHTCEEAVDAVGTMFAGKFGDAGKTVLIEDFMEGEEASFFALTDGKTVLPLSGAQDHKRVGEGDTGPNTGGMGAYSPAAILDENMTRLVMDRIIEPTVKAMAENGTPFQGVLYAGLMIGPDGPRLIEYNVRFGDPECQVLMPRLTGDIVPVLMALAQGDLEGCKLTFSTDAALTVVMATRGYPDGYEKGSEIRGLEKAAATPGVHIFHAGTRADGKRILAHGGRVLNVTATAPTVAEARMLAYRAIASIDWPEGFCRQDIAWRALQRESADTLGSL